MAEPCPSCTDIGQRYDWECCGKPYLEAIGARVVTVCCNEPRTLVRDACAACNGTGFKAPDTVEQLRRG